MTTLLWALAILLVLLGLAGTVLPALPGPILVFAGLLLGAWADGFTRVGAFTIAVLASLTVLTYVIDLAASALGVKRFGASKRAVLGALAGMLVGLFFGLPGVILGPFVGALLAELTVRGDMRQASRAGVGAWIGLVIGMAARLTLVFAMLGIFIVVLMLG